MATLVARNQPFYKLLPVIQPILTRLNAFWKMVFLMDLNLIDKYTRLLKAICLLSCDLWSIQK